MAVDCNAVRVYHSCCFFFNDTATTEIYTLSLHDALPISMVAAATANGTTMANTHRQDTASTSQPPSSGPTAVETADHPAQDRKSTRLNSSHSSISYAVFCLKKKKKTHRLTIAVTPQNQTV